MTSETNGAVHYIWELAPVVKYRSRSFLNGLKKIIKFMTMYQRWWKFKDFMKRFVQ